MGKQAARRWNVPLVNRRVGVHGNTLLNLRQAVVERVFMVKNAEGNLEDVPRPEPGFFARRLAGVKSRILQYVRRVLPLSSEEFLSTYSGRRRLLYQRARDVYNRRGVRARDARIRGFLKIEPVLKVGAVPRIIQPRCPRLPVYGYALGRYIKRYEAVFKKILKRVAGYDVIVKGRDPRSRATLLRQYWDSYRDCIVVGMDASRFDQHVSVEALKWEHSVWMSMCPSVYRKELKMLLDLQLRNQCVASCPEGTVRYTTEGCRMSGDMNTSAGNCMLMSCMLLEYANDRGVDVKVVNDGDDSIVFMERRTYGAFREGLEQWFEKMGFAMEVEDPVDRFERIDFCQSSPVWTDAGWIMVRNPTKSMGKDLTTTRDFPDEASILQWLQSVFSCGRCLADGVPVLSAFYEMFDAGVALPKVVPESLEERGLYRSSRGLKYRNVPITSAARASFYNAFGILPDCQVLLESHFKKFKICNFKDMGNIDPWKLPTIPSPIPPRF